MITVPVLADCHQDLYAVKKMCSKYLLKKNNRKTNKERKSKVEARDMGWQSYIIENWE